MQQRGAAIIKARGLSSAASAANAAIDHVRDWALGTPDGDWVSMAHRRPTAATASPKGSSAPFPCTCYRTGSTRSCQGLDIDDFSRARIDASVAELVEERDAVQGARADRVRFAGEPEVRRRLT